MWKPISDLLELTAEYRALMPVDTTYTKCLQHISGRRNSVKDGRGNYDIIDMGDIIDT